MYPLRRGIPGPASEIGDGHVDGLRIRIGEGFNRVLCFGPVNSQTDYDRN